MRRRPGRLRGKRPALTRAQVTRRTRRSQTPRTSTRTEIWTIQLVDTTDSRGESGRCSWSPAARGSRLTCRTCCPPHS